MTKAKYNYKILKIEDRPFIVIWDNGTAKVDPPVTREIHAVVDELCTKERITPVDYFIIYKDRRGVWDGYIYSTGQFVELRVETGFQDAGKKMMAIQD